MRRMMASLCQLIDSFYLLSPMLLTSPIAASVPNLNVVNCTNAIHTCATTTHNCQVLFVNYKVSCSQQTKGKTLQGLCFDKCRKELITLSSLVEGYKVITCECEPDNTMCIIEKERLSHCWTDKINFTTYDFDNHSARTKSCKTLRDDCKKNEFCRLAYFQYGIVCRSAIETTTEPCSEQCAARARTLYAISNGYFTCDCEGDWWCSRENQLIAAKCFGNAAIDVQASLAALVILSLLWILCIR